MAHDAAKNFVKVTVDGTYSAGSTEIYLVPGDCDKLPEIVEGEEYNLVWYDDTNYPDQADDPSVEVVRVMGVEAPSNLIILLRGQEDTIDTDKGTPGATYKMVLGLTAKVLNDTRTPPGNNGSVVLNVEGKFGHDDGLSFAEGQLMAPEVSVAEGAAILKEDRIHFPMLSGPPADPVEGDAYGDGTAHVLMYYNGTAWVEATTPP